MPTNVQQSGSALKAAYDRLFENDGSNTHFKPRFLLIKVPAGLATSWSFTPSGGDYTLPAGHPFVEGEIVKLASPPVSPAPATHPYYWIKALSGNTATLSAGGPDATDPSITSTGGAINGVQVDLPAERAAHGLVGVGGVSDRSLIYSATIRKNEVLHGAAGTPRPELTHASGGGLVFPAGWPASGKISYKVETDPYTLVNSGGSAIVFRHVIVQMRGGNNQGDAVRDPQFFPEGINTTIAIGGQQIFNFTLGTQEI